MLGEAEVEWVDTEPHAYGGAGGAVEILTLLRVPIVQVRIPNRDADEIRGM